MGLSFPVELTTINDRVSVLRRDNFVYYYMQKNLIYIHKTSDKIAFQFIACQLVLSCLAKQTEIIRVFNVSKSSLIRWIKKYRQEGAKGFLRKNKRFKIEKLHKKGTKKRKRKKILNIVGETIAIQKNGIRKFFI